MQIVREMRLFIIIKDEKKGIGHESCRNKREEDKGECDEIAKKKRKNKMKIAKETWVNNERNHIIGRLWKNEEKKSIPRNETEIIVVSLTMSPCSG